jgi:CRISPR/Cas system-associated endonuclease/helicase Cas3
MVSWLLLRNVLVKIFVDEAHVLYSWKEFHIQAQANVLKNIRLLDIPIVFLTATCPKMVIERISEYR